jgi:hypothetical protein
MRFHARAASERSISAWRRWPAWAGIAVVAIALILPLPASRIAAQQLWQFLTVRKVAVIRVKPWPEGVPAPRVKMLGTPIPPIPARDVHDVRWRVRYDPRLPRPGILASGPRLSTTFSLSAGIVIRTADLELVLQKAGISDQAVPPQWDGAQFS